jgi:iron complex outermembrane receptor protein
LSLCFAVGFFVFIPAIANWQSAGRIVSRLTFATISFKFAGNIQAVIQAYIGPYFAEKHLNPGKMRGAEAELTVVPLSGLTLRAGVALLDAWIENTALPDGSITDVRPSQAPKSNITSSVNYNFGVWGRGSMQVGADWSYRSLVYYSLLNDPASRQAGYGLLHLRAEYTTPDGHWSFKLHGENVLNKEYLNNSIVTGGIGFGQGSPGLPVTYGIRFSYHL